ncbi:thioesterase family protein [Brevibacillus laterosporus]|nr:thioesterase family protein [Brevibacillus laterosporus]MDN9011875.1 thioesterase family protein [Brevibacillus laterosporus]MDO0942971.1 thioesterase family protein [Brevibacillus laterosporus]
MKKRENKEATDMAHTFVFTVRSTEVDFIGHVNNAKYLEYMEWARFDWLIAEGYTIEELQRRHIFPVVVNMNVNYRSELVMGDEITIHTTLVNVGKRSFVIKHELHHEKKGLVADGLVTMVMIDQTKRRAVELPNELKELFLSIQKEELIP